MKSIGRITGGLVLVVALLFFAGIPSLSAQGPTPTPGSSSTGSPTSAPGPNATPGASPAATSTANPSPAASPTGTAVPNPTAVPNAGSSPVPGAACTNIATFVSDVTIPDNSVVTPGATFTKTWQMRNRGTCTWGTGYNLAFVTGQAMTSNLSIAVPETAPVATADLSVPLTAPASAGVVQGFWQLQAPDGTRFGPRVWVLVDVGGTMSPAPAGAPPAPAPAQAPPLTASNTNLDDPARAVAFGNTISNLPPGTAEWLQFNYNSGGGTSPRPTVTVLLLNGVTNGLAFEIYAPDRMANGWSNNPPVGRGTTEMIPACNSSGGPCSTDNLSWTGGFGLDGTYYVRVLNNTGAAVDPQIIIGGPGLAQCLTPSQAATTVTNPNGPFAQLRCTAPMGATSAP